MERAGDWQVLLVVSALSGANSIDGANITYVGEHIAFGDGGNYSEFRLFWNRALHNQNPYESTPTLRYEKVCCARFVRFCQLIGRQCDNGMVLISP